LIKLKKVFERKLWNGSYYNFDSSGSYTSKTIMADQLAGEWYSRSCGLESIHPQGSTITALEKIFENNVMKIKDGNQGAINGMTSHSSSDTSNPQSQEIWPSTNFALAATMIQEGLTKQAFKTIEGIYKNIYNNGFWFQTPEAWDINLNYRSSTNARAMSIWAMQWAWEKRGQKAEEIKQIARQKVEKKNSNDDDNHTLNNIQQSSQDPLDRILQQAESEQDP